MAEINAALGDAEQTGDNAFIIDGSQSGEVNLPEHLSVSEADFTMEGGDLVMSFPDGTTVTVEGYADNPSPPTLASADGAEVGADVVGALTGGGADAPATGGDFGFVEPEAAEAIQAAERSGNIADNPAMISGTDGEPIGNVENMEGEVWAVRVDGTRVRLELGDEVYQGDILESGPDGKVGILLADETSFAMGPEGRMVLDEMVYDPATQEGAVSMSVLQGVFTFVSGQVAKTDPDAMTLDTPVATIGIRGTQVGLDIRDGESLNVHLMEEQFGFVGEVVVVNDGGVQVLNDANALTSVASFDTAPSPFRIASVREIIETYGSSTLSHLPTRSGDGERSSANTYEQQPEIEGENRESQDFLDGFQTDAGGPQESPAGGETVPVGDIIPVSTLSNAPGVNNLNLINPVQFAPTAPVSQTGPISRAAATIQSPPPPPEPVGPPPPPPVPGQILNIPGVLGGSVSDDGRTITLDVTGDVDLSDFDFNFVVRADDTQNALTTGSGDDTLTGTGGDDIIDGGAGNDTFIASPGGGDDTYIGGDGIDTITFANADGDLIIDLDTGTFNGQTRGTATDGLGADGIGTDTIIEIENVIGGRGNDFISGDAADNVIRGGLGNDIIDGRGGQDTAEFSGTRGSSTFNITNGVLTVSGPDGIDTIVNVENFVFDDTPNLVVGLEDTAISVNVADFVPQAADATATLIAGVPAGAALSAGTLLPDGTWLVNNGDLGGLTVTGAADSSEDFTLVFQAYNADYQAAVTQAATQYLATQVDEETGTPLQTLEQFLESGGDPYALLSAGQLTQFMPSPVGAGSMNIEVIGVVDPFTITVDGVELTQGGANGITFAGTEDQPIDLNILSELGDTDGSEVLSVTISGLPTVEVEQVERSIQVPVQQPVLDPDGNPTFDEQGNPITETVFETQTEIVWEPVLDENGDPVGAHLIYTDENGNDVVLPANDTGTYTLTQAQLNNLRLVGSPDDSGSFDLSISAQVSDGGDSISTVFGSASVTIAAEADVPTVNGEAQVTLEDQPVQINFDIDKNDESEHITQVTLSGIPAGSKLAIEYTNPDTGETMMVALPVSNGTANIPVGLLGDDLSTENLQLTPPAHLSGLFNLQLNVTSTEPSNGDSAVNHYDMPLRIVAVADELGVTINGHDVVDGDTVQINALEDGAFALDISALTEDTDGSEVLSITLSGIPDGALLSAGTKNADGTWTLTPEDVDGLQITPPANSDVDFSIGVTVTNIDNNEDVRTLEATVNVGLEAIADAANLTVDHTIEGVEDFLIPLDIASSLNDTDGSESLAITISGLPAGSMLTAGVQNEDGSWTLTPEQLDGLALQPGPHISGAFDLTVTATTTELANGDTASVSQVIGLNILPNPDAPVVNVTSVSGSEDTAIPLNIDASLIDTDGSETLSISISGVPEGALLSAGTHVGNGVWELDPADLANLSVVPPLNSNEDFTLTVTATATESNGEIAETVVDLPVTVLGVADAPELVSDTIVGLEGTDIPLNIVAALGDTDGSETLSITIENIPNGAILKVPATDESGVPILDDLGEAIYNTLQIVNQSATLTSDQLQGLVISPPTGSDDDFDLLVTATATENDNDISANGQGVSSVSGTLSVVVQEVADTPALMLFDSVGNEDTAIPLSIAAILTDDDETLSVTVSGVPEGVTLSKGTLNEDGTWSLGADDLAGLTMTTPENFSGEFSISVTATSTTGDGTTASQSGTLNVSVRGVADAPNLELVDLSGTEDSLIPLSIGISAGLVDTDGSETLSITIGNLPEGAQLFTGITDLENLDGLTGMVPLPVVDGVVHLTAEQLVGLVMLPPPGLDTDFTLQVTATATEADAALTGNNQGVASVSGVINVDMTAVADVPTLILQNAFGNEDEAIPLDISAMVDDASETLSITIANVPAGAVLSAGSNNNDGTWTLTPAQLEGLTITPPANSNEDFQLEITATSTEQDGTSASTTSSLSIGVTGVADAPNLSFGDLTGSEDTLLPLNISASLADTDGSETLSVTIGGMPAGATLSAGIKNGDGTWTLTGEQLTGLKLSPPTDFSGNFSLTVTATSTENDGDTASLTGLMNIDLSAVADIPTLILHDAAGFEDDAIPLEISTAAQGGDEIVGITITGVPQGAMLSAGTNNGNGTWTLTEEQLDGLTITPPANSNVNFNLGVTVTSMDGGDLAETSQNLAVSVTGVADKPLLNVPSQLSVEGAESIALGIDAALTDLDGSESLSVSISNIPEGSIIRLGNTVLDVVGGVVSDLLPSQLSGLSITPPVGFDGNFTLQVTATSSETDPDSIIPEGLETNISIGYIDITVDGLIPDLPDVPDLDVSNTLGYEDSAIPLNINAALTDLSETLSITISNVPEGATLSSGTSLGNGVWSLLPEELEGLTITAPQNSNEDFNLTVTATSTTEDGSFATNSGVVAVDVIGVADQPNLAVTIGEGAVIGDAIRDIPTFDHAISNVVMYLRNEDGSINKIKVDDFDDGANEIFDVNDIDLLGFVADNYPGAELVGLSVKAGNNGGALGGILGPGEGEFFLIDPGTIVNMLPLSSHADQTLDFDESLEAYVGESISELATVFPLNITSSLNDLDGSETLSITVADLPAGVTLSAGVQNQDGSWTLTPQELDGLTMSVPQGTDLDFDFSVTATATENDGDTASVSLGVGIDGDTEADAPELAVSAAAGDEDAAIPLVIDAALTDTDGSETLSITISGVPNGAVLSAGTEVSAGTWELTPEQLAGLSITPPADSDVDFDLTVTATSTETSTGDIATQTAVLSVAVNAVADAPSAAAGDVDGDVGQTVLLDIESILSDTDGSESLSINIAGLPDGASLNNGTLNNDGSYTLSVVDLDGLAISLPSDTSDDFDLSVTATATEAANLDQASIVVTAVVNVDPLANDDNNAVRIGEVTTGNVLTGEGDTVDVDAAADIGSESGNSIVDVSFGGVTKSFSNPGDVQSDTGGNFIEIAGEHGTLKMYSDGSYDYAADASEAVSHLAGLTGTASSSAVEEAWSGVQTMAFDFGTSYVDGNGRFDPTLANAQVTYTPEGIGVAGTQNGMPVPDQINHDDQTGQSQALAIDLGGSTSSATLTVSRLFRNEEGGEQGAWQAYDAEGNFVGEGVLNASTVDYSGSSNVGVANISLPDGAAFKYLVFTATDTASESNPNDSSDFFVRALQYETNEAPTGEDVFTYTMQDADGDSAAATLSIDVSEESDTTASMPTLSVDDAVGLEDSAIALDIAAGLGDLDGSETLSITISGMPNGATLSAGVQNDDGTWSVHPDDLAGLTVTPPADSNEDFELTINATSTEQNGGATSSTSAVIAVAVAGVADTPSLAVTLGEPTENPGTNSVTITNMGDAEAGYNNSYGYYIKDAEGNPTEGVVIWKNVKNDIGDTFTIEGVDPNSIGYFVIPNGGGLNLSVGNETPVTFQQTPSGNWQAVGPTGTPLLGAGDPVLFSDPALNEGGFDYAIDNSNAGNQNWEDLVGGGDNDFNDVNVNVDVSDTGQASTATYPLIITSELSDVDGSETLSITVGNLPEGATLSAGTVNQDGSVTLTPQQLSGLTMTIPVGIDDFALEIISTATENDGDSVSVSTTINVDAPDGDTTASDPTLTVNNAAGLEDNAIPLDISGALTDTDGSEVLSFTISGVPNGATLSNGVQNSDGTWSLTPAQLDGLSITPPQNSNVDFSLTVTATSMETNGGATSTTSATLDVDVTGVADAANLTASASLADGHGTGTGTRSGSGSGSGHGSGHGSGSGSGSGVGADVVSFFEINSGDRKLDDEANTSDGTLHGVTINSESDGPSSASAVFDGDNDYVEVKHKDDYELSEGTFVLWFNTEDAGDKQALFSKDSSGYDDGGHLTAWVDDGQLEVRMQSSSNSYMVQGGSVSTGAWHQMAFSFGPTGMALYLDGELIDTDSFTGGMSDNEEPLVFGANTWASSDGEANNLRDFFAGQMDKISVYNRALTPTEIANLHDEGVQQMTGTNGETLVYDLDIEGSLVDVDGSETLTFQVRGLPDGVSLSAGSSDGNGTWSLTGAELEGLTLSVDPNVGDDFSIEVVAITTEDDGDVTESVASIEIDVPVTDPVVTRGTSSAETLKGGRGDDTLYGEGGNDNLYGYGGNDILDGGSGHDSLFGDAGDDMLRGGHGNDYLSGGAGADTLDGGTGHDTLEGGEGNDVLLASHGDDKLYGGAGDDTLDGGTGHDTLEGGDGNDVLDGGSNNDKLYGGAGDDTLLGGSGDDTLVGGEGDDVLSGGWGNDTFRMDANSGHDIIQDIMEQDTVVFEGQEFHADDMIFNENEDGDVVISFAGVEGQSVTLNGVKMDDLDQNNDGDPSDGYSVTERDGQVSIQIDAQ